MEGTSQEGHEAHSHGMSKLKAGTRKLAAKLGIHKKKDRGSPGPGSPGPGSPGRPASPVSAAGAPGSPLAPAPLTPSRLGGPQEAPATSGGSAPLLAAASPLEAGSPALQPQRGAASASYERSPPASPLRPPTAADLESTRERMARLRAAAEQAAYGALPAGAKPAGATSPLAPLAQQHVHAGEAAAALPASSPRQQAAHTAPVAPYRAPAAHPPAPTAAATVSPTAVPEAAAAERQEEEGVALFKPVVADTRRGRLAAAVALSTPYGAVQAGPVQQEAAPEAPEPWQAAAEHPVAAVGGASGRTHVSGRPQVAAVLLHPAPAAAETAGVGARAAPLPAQQQGQEQPLSPADVQQGEDLAAADAAAGLRAATDAAAAAAAGLATLAGVQLQQEQQEQQQQQQLHQLQPQRASPQQQPQAEQEEGAAPREGLAPSESSTPLLPAGAFNQEQDISVFSPRDPTAYEVRNDQAAKALEVLSPGPAATVGPHTEEEIELAPYAAGASPERLSQGPFGAQINISLFAPEGHLDRRERGPISLDRRTESESVVVEELAERLQASSELREAAREAAARAQYAAAASHLVHITPHPAHLLGVSEGPEPGASPREQMASEPATPQAAFGRGASPAAASTAPADSTAAGAGEQEFAVETAAQPEEQQAERQLAGTEPDEAQQEAEEGRLATLSDQEVPEQPEQQAEQGQGQVPEQQLAGSELATAEEQLPFAEREQGQLLEQQFISDAQPAAVPELAQLEQPAGAELAQQVQQVQQPAEAQVTGAEQWQEAESEQWEGAEQAAEAPVTATVTGAAQGAAARAGEAATAAKEAAGGAAAVVAGAAVGAAAAVKNAAVRTVTAVRIAAGGAAAAASGAAGTAAETADQAAGTASEGAVAAGLTAEEEAGPSSVAESSELPAADAAETSPAAAAAGGAEGEGLEVTERELAQEAEEAPSPGTGLAASLLGAAASAVHAVQEQFHSVLERGRELAAAEDTAEGTDMAAGGGSIAGSMQEEEGEQQAQPQVEQVEQQELLPQMRQEQGSGVPAGGAVVLPVSGQAHQQTMKEAVEDESAVSASLLQALEGAEEPGQMAAASAAAAGGAVPTPAVARHRAADEGVVLPVAVRQADQETEGAAVQLSPAVDASLAVEEEAPEAAVAELAAAAREAQPESLDATAEYFSEREAGRAQEGQQRREEEEQGKEQGPQIRLQMKDISGLAAMGPSPAVTPSTTQPGPASDLPVAATAGAAGAMPATTQEGPSAASQEPAPRAQLITAYSAGGLREPPPTPTTSTSPAAGGPGDVAAAGRSTGARPLPSRLLTCSTFGSSTGEAEAAPLVEDLGVAPVAPAQRVQRMQQAAVDWVKINPVLAAGAVALVPLLWLVLRRAAIAVFGEFGPALLLSGAIAVAGTALSWMVLAARAAVPDSELEMLQAQAATVAGDAGGAPGPADSAPAGGAGGADAREEAALMSPSEPVSEESTEDLAAGAAAGGRVGGLFQTAREAVASTVEEVIESVEPGREQVGEVIQESESTGEGLAEEAEGEAGGEDPLGSALRAVTGAATAAVQKVEALADRAYKAMAREAPGADVGGEGAPMKGIAEGMKETAELAAEEEAGGFRQLAPAAPEPTARPPAPPATRGGRGGEIARESGYESDSEGPDPVPKGVHPAHHQQQHPASTPGGGLEYHSAAVVVAEQAAASHMHAQQEVAVEGEGSGVVEATLQGEERPGLLTRAAEAGGHLAASAAGAVKHAAERATGTAPEQRAPKDQLKELQQSIADMEGERAGDVAFQKASKELGM